MKTLPFYVVLMVSTFKLFLRQGWVSEDFLIRKCVNDGSAVEGLESSHCPICLQGPDYSVCAAFCMNEERLSGEMKKYISRLSRQKWEVASAEGISGSNQNSDWSPIGSISDGSSRRPFGLLVSAVLGLSSAFNGKKEMRTRLVTACVKQDREERLSEDFFLDDEFFRFPLAQDFSSPAAWQRNWVKILFETEPF